MTSRRDALKSAALLPLAATPICARAAPAVSGAPVAGHFTHDSVRLFLQATQDAAATVRYWPEASEDRAATAKASLFKATEHIETLELRGLAAATTYRYRVTLEGGGSAVGSFRTAPEPGSAPAESGPTRRGRIPMRANSNSARPYRTRTSPSCWPTPVRRTRAGPRRLSS